MTETGAGVVVVGGGFAGFWAAVAARRIAGDGTPITLVSRDGYLVVRPRLYEAFGDALRADLTGPLALADVRLVEAEAERVDVGARCVVLAGSRRVEYERLVVATGSVMRRPPVPGADLACAVDSWDEAAAFDERLGAIARAGDAGSTPTVVVIGGGFTGIELALELRDRVEQHGGADRAERLRIVLVERADAVGPELGPGPRPAIEAALADASVEVLLGVSVARIDERGVALADGTTIDASLVVLTTGMVASPFVAGLPGEHDELGRLVVDRELRALDTPDVFVTGDAAAAIDDTGYRVLMSCQHALQLGRFAGENAARSLAGLPLVPYRQPPYVTCLDLGRSGAVLTAGWEREVRRAGADAKPIKRRINTEIIYPPWPTTRDELLMASNLEVADRRPPAAAAG